MISQRTKFGSLYRREVENPKIKIEVLKFIRINLAGYSYNALFTLDEFCKEGYHYASRACQRERLKRLVKNGWLSKKMVNGNLTFETTKKFRRYLEEFGSFENPEAPLMKEKVREVVVEKPHFYEVEKKSSREIKPIDRV